jgi:hypothetical protein
MLTAIQRAKGSELALLDLEIVMGQHFRQINRSKSHRNHREAGEALLDVLFGECFRCGKKEHCANQCPDKGPERAEGQNKSKRNVNRCISGKISFRAAQYCHEEENVYKQPTGLKPIGKKNEVGALANIDAEILLVRINNLLAYQQDILIADSAAVVHMTPKRINKNPMDTVFLPW